MAPPRPCGRTAAEGDWVALYAGHEEVMRVRLARGGRTQGKHGLYLHDDIIDKARFGSRLYDTRKNNKNSVILLPPTVELRTVSMRFRTQILYGPDLGLVGMLLNLFSGARIVESGTGSGSATMSFARAIQPSGQVYTFEFNEERYKAAVEEFAELGLSNVVRCHHRNVYEAGFGPQGRDLTPPAFPAPAGCPEETADAAFIDLPAPWLAVEHVNYVLKPHGRVVFFSPCHEQVNETAEALNKLQYQDVAAYEVISKPWGVWTSSDAARKACRTRQAQEANLAAGRTKRAPQPLAGDEAAAEPAAEAAADRGTTPPRKIVFERSPATFYQLSTRGHTGYIVVATKPPKLSAEFIADSQKGVIAARVRPVLHPKARKRRKSSDEVAREMEDAEVARSNNALLAEITSSDDAGAGTGAAAGGAAHSQQVSDTH